METQEYPHIRFYTYDSRSVIVSTYDLQDPAVLKYYRDDGFHWIRRVDQKNYKSIIREPTIGWMVELKTSDDLRCAHLDTKKAKRLIKTLNYFTNYMYI